MLSSPVDWGGLHNARELGGSIQPGALFRSPRLDGLDSDGWQQLAASGVRTIVDVRNDDEVTALPLRPTSLRVIRAPVEDQTDDTFMAEWGAHLGTPAYYAENLRRWPSLIAEAVGAVADAPVGGVLVHCAAGRDRTGLVVALLLAVADVPAADILDDYELGVRETNTFLRSHPDAESHLEPDSLDESVAAKRAMLGDLLDRLDVSGYLIEAGVTHAQLARLRTRLSTDSGPPPQ